MSNEMRKCNACKQEKAISEFHRRGAGHLNTCKACKNEQIREYRRQEKSPRPIKDNRENFSTIGDRTTSQVREKLVKHFGSDKKAVEFREWLDSVGGTSESLDNNLGRDIHSITFKEE